MVSSQGHMDNKDMLMNDDDQKWSFQGHKWSLSAFLKHLKANNIDTVQLMQSIEDVIIKVVIIVFKTLLNS